MENKDIKELLELFKGLEPIAQFVGQVLKDGKVGADDLAHLVALGASFSQISNGFKGLDIVKEELKDLEVDEILQIVQAAYAVSDAFNNAKSA